MARFPKLQMLDDDSLNDVLSTTIQRHFADTDISPLQILEAGCGSKWLLNLTGVDYTLTGVDIFERDLEIRKNEIKDLDVAVVGDLRSVELESEAYDVIYNSWVLEHIDGARRVLDNFVRWIKPGGKIIVKIPDRDTCFGFYTRVTPLWFHLIYKRYVEGNKNAGTPGFGPFPVFYDKVVSRKGMREYCETNGLKIEGEYGLGGYLKRASVFAYLSNALVWITQRVTFGHLSGDHTGLAFVISKPKNFDSTKEAND